MNAALSCLTQEQRDVALRALATEQAQRSHVVVSLSGAHAYGFPSPDSDLDIKCIHAEPTRALLGFPRAQKAAERLEVIDGVEFDYSSNELGAALQGVLKGNGNYLERFLSGFVIEGNPVLAELTPLVQATVSKRVHRHYRGFATQQRFAWDEGGRTSAKKLLYVLRTALTGAHLLTTGQVVTDVTKLLEPAGFADAMELIVQKRRGEKSELPPAMSAAWARRLDDVFGRLDRAHDESTLPDAPDEGPLEAWLVEFRLRDVR